MLGPLADFFLLFALPSTALAILALRDFLHRDVPHEGMPRVKRAVMLLLGATGLMELLVLVAFITTGGAPLRTEGGWVFLGFGAVMALLGPIGAALFRRAAAAPLRRNVKAAETVPMLVVMLNLVLVVNAAMQVPG